MQVRQVVAAALLAITAVGAMSQELDPGETLQAKNLAAQKASAERTRESVVAETRNLQAEGQLKTVGERADATPVAVVPQTQAKAPAAGRTRAEVKAELTEWRKSHPLVAGDRG